MAGKQESIYFLGDSLVEYYDWAARFPASRVYNLGVSGETVEELEHRVNSRIVPELPEPDWIFIMSGINNVLMEMSEIYEPYRRVIRNLRRGYGRSRIYACSLLPTRLAWAGPDLIAGMNERLAVMARKESAYYLDVFSHFFGEDGRLKLDGLMPDGVHLSFAGYRIWSDLVAEVLEKSNQRS